ncbi:uncharacterized protein L199_006384 [Kwoniella botswanensis]|uniref:uncharacterized protein n=1 Tax=Kwoniella botswanensis TaxID=1268659 RepID=UPI00315CA75B
MSTVGREEASPLLPSTAEPSPSRVTLEERGSGSGGNLDMVPTSRDKLALASILIGLTLVLSTSWYLVFSGSLKEMGWFAVHPPMQSLAITAFLLGITPLQPPPPNSTTKKNRFKTHQSVMLGFALPLLAIGSSAMIYNKYLHGAKHFTTWHGKLGLISVIWVVAQASIGAASVWGGGKAFGGEEKAKRVYKYHRLSGYLLITLMLFTIHLAGIHSDWANGRGYTNLRILAYYVGLPLIWLGIELRSR